MINITRHALMRYISRRDLSHVINDSTFDSWRREFPDKADEYQKMLLAEIDNASFITERAFNTFKKAKYYINTETMMIFVINESNLVTCYLCDYGVGHDSNAVILSGLILGMKNKEEEIESYNKKSEEINKLCYDNISRLKEEANSLEMELQAIRKEIKTNEALLEQVDSNKKSLATQLFNIVSKIVKPKNSL